MSKEKETDAAKKKKATTKKKSTKKKTSPTEKKLFERIPKFVKIIAVVVIIIGILVFFTPLFGVLDKATNGYMTTLWGEVVKIEDVIINENINDDNIIINNNDIPKDEKVGLPAFAAGDKMVVKHKYYTLRYNDKHEQPEWVAYLLKKSHVNGDNERNDHFREDPDVPTQSASPTDYRKSGYDRGHLAPAADFNFSAEAVDESFFMSNMSPQEPAFNRGIWKGLEGKVRQWATEKNEVYVVTGPILKSKLKTIGEKNKVSVPLEFYKIVLNLNEKHPHAIAFLMPNKRCEGFYEDYMISIDKLEELTGIDFFANLPDELENYLEKSALKDSWFAKPEAVPSPMGDMRLLE